MSYDDHCREQQQQQHHCRDYGIVSVRVPPLQALDRSQCVIEIVLSLRLLSTSSDAILVNWRNVFSSNALSSSAVSFHNMLRQRNAKLVKLQCAVDGGRRSLAALSVRLSDLGLATCDLRRHSVLQAAANSCDHRRTLPYLRTIPSKHPKQT